MRSNSGNHGYSSGQESGGSGHHHHNHQHQFNGNGNQQSITGRNITNGDRHPAGEDTVVVRRVGSEDAVQVNGSSNRILIKGGRVINHDNLFDADVYIEDGIIS
jgi:hypothetical protein